MHEDISNWEHYKQTNLNLWNQRTAVHTESKFYDISGFLQGKTVLNDIELNLVGGVSGKSLLHLQCHFGLDTLNWARLGAQVTGLDFSDKAIAKAKSIAEEANINANFICDDVYQAIHNPELQNQQFDIVFTTYGTIGWLPDLTKWANTINQFLKPGGKFVIVDFHPALWMFSDDFSQLAYSYFNKEVIAVVDAPTYTENSEKIIGSEYGWNHSFGEIFTALLAHNLQLKHFQEYDYSPYPCFANTIEIEPNKWQIDAMQGDLPMLYSIVMEKLK